MEMGSPHKELGRLSMPFDSRSYRTLSRETKTLICELIALCALFYSVIFLAYPSLIAGISKITQKILVFALSLSETRFTPLSVFWTQIETLVLQETSPSFLLCDILFVISLGLLIFSVKTKKAKPLAYFLTFFSVINLIAALCFLFAPHKLPYTLNYFTEIYIRTEVIIWLIIPFLLSSVLLMLPTSLLSKVALIGLTLLYSIVFGIARYICFIVLLKKFSMILMPVLFFSFGPFLDLIYIVGAYSLYMKWASHHLAKKREVWN